MKRTLLFILLLVTSTSIYSESVWRIHGTDILNVREQPSTQSNVICTVNRNDIINVLEEQSDEKWLKIEMSDGIYGYVSAKYVEKEEIENVQSDTNDKEVSFGFVLPWSRPIKTWMTITLLCIAFVTWFIARFFEDESALVTLSSVILCIAVLAYVCYMGGNALWFLLLDKVGGWGWLILHGILFLFVVFAQLLGFFHSLEWIEEETSIRKSSLLVGIFAIPALFIGLIVAGFKFPEYSLWVVIAFLLIETLQTIYVFAKGERIAALLFLIEVLSTTLLLIPAIVIGVIIAVIFVILLLVNGVSKMESSIPSYSPSSNNVDSSSEEKDYDVKIKDEYGETHELKRDGLGRYDDEKGRKWKEGINPGEFVRDHN